MGGLPGEYVIPGGLLNIHEHTILVLLSAILMLTFSIFGIFSNVVNIKTFLAMGLDDAVTVSFLCLAVSDLVCSFSVLAMGLIVSLRVHELYVGQIYTHDPVLLGIIVNNIGNTLYVVTILTTLYIAVARCMCVAKPLHFKHVFTPKRSYFVVLFFVFYAIGSNLPNLAHFRVKTTFSSVLNNTRYVITFAPGRETVKDFVYMINMIIIPFSSEAIVIICVLVMMWKLAKASAFRRSMISQQQTTEDMNKGDDLNTSGTKQSNLLSGKELLAVKQVLLISILFIFLNMPTILTALFGMLDIGFDASWTNDRYARMYHSVHKLRRSCEQINSSINIFVYYYYNTKFRSKFRLCPWSTAS